MRKDTQLVKGHVGYAELLLGVEGHLEQDWEQFFPMRPEDIQIVRKFVELYAHVEQRVHLFVRLILAFLQTSVSNDQLFSQISIQLVLRIVQSLLVEVFLDASKNLVDVFLELLVALELGKFTNAFACGNLYHRVNL